MDKLKAEALVNLIEVRLNEMETILKSLRWHVQRLKEATRDG
jgi:hypothetical protein